MIKSSVKSPLSAFKCSGHHSGRFFGSISRRHASESKSPKTKGFSIKTGSRQRRKSTSKSSSRLPDQTLGLILNPWMPFRGVLQIRKDAQGDDQPVYTSEIKRCQIKRWVMICLVLYCIVPDEKNRNRHDGQGRVSKLRSMKTGDKQRLSPGCRDGRCFSALLKHRYRRSTGIQESWRRWRSMGHPLRFCKSMAVAKQLVFKVMLI